MVRERRGAGPPALGHIAVYARDGRWRRAVARHLDEAGHSHHEAATPWEIRQLLLGQRFDVLALKVRDSQDAREVAAALDGIALPPHGILVGGASARLLSLPAGRDGALRYVPAPLSAREVSRLVDVSVSAGTREEGAIDHGAPGQMEEVDVEELIERAASAVYAQARRKQQRFSSVVEGPVARVVANPARLRHAVVELLRLSVALAPRGALVAVEARAGRDEWSILVRTSAGRRRPRLPAQLAEALREETQVLTMLSREIQQQGGLLWAELLGPDALALCLSLPLAMREGESASA